MKKKKDGPPNRSWIAAVICFVLATTLWMFEVADVWIIYGFAGLFYISWQFDKTDWLILEVSRIFVDGLKSPEEREDDK